MMHSRRDDEVCERAALYSVGALTADESAAYESHLALCATCRDVVQSLVPAVDELAQAAPEADPPPALRTHLLERIAAQGRLALARAAGRLWEATGVEGVDICRLFLDVARDRQTILVRMRKGSSYPVHTHRGFEECYVIEGDLVDGDQCLVGGDYVCHGAGTEHAVRTVGGCLLLVQSSIHDEVVAHPGH